MRPKKNHQIIYISGLIDLCRKRSDTIEIFHNFLIYFVVIPVIICEREKSSSKMLIGKTKLRCMMAQERLNALLFLVIEHKEFMCISISNTSLIILKIYQQKEDTLKYENNK